MNHLKEFQITPIPESKSFRFRLLFHEKSQQVEFEIPFRVGMHILKILQRFQVQYKLPIPLRERPRARPRFYVVKDDAES